MSASGGITTVPMILQAQVRQLFQSFASAHHLFANHFSVLFTII